jgi:hypothetical protein
MARFMVAFHVLRNMILHGARQEDLPGRHGRPRYNHQCLICLSVRSRTQAEVGP